VEVMGMLLPGCFPLREGEGIFLSILENEKKY
jgi:hypothetical protein